MGKPKDNTQVKDNTKDSPTKEYASNKVSAWHPNGSY